MIFSWAAGIIDAWLFLARSFKSMWRSAPGDLMALLVIRACGITAPGRRVASVAADEAAIVIEDPAAARYLDHQWIPVHAQTLGRYILARKTLDDHTLAHELEHVRQWQRLGPLFLPSYVAASAIAHLRHRPVYWGNHYESAARRRADLDCATSTPQTSGSSRIVSRPNASSCHWPPESSVPSL